MDYNVETTPFRDTVYAMTRRFDGDRIADASVVVAAEELRRRS